jgi:tetratricopeptide (TPR) repeat protein
MKLSLSRISTAMILAFFIVSSAGCTLVNKIRAKNELNEAARSYREAHLDEAEKHAQRALDLDATNPTAPIFIARIIHQEYLNKAEDKAKARQAIDAYKRVLERDPNNDEAYKAISVLYSSLKDDENLRAWIMKRATDSSKKEPQRSEAYAVLAGMDQQCSFQITELPEVKTITQTGGKPSVTYKKPKDTADFDKASKCVARGLEEANTAIKFDPNSEAAWSAQANLFVEQAKLAEMDGKPDQKAAASKKAEDAAKRANTLHDQNQKAAGSPQASG